MGLAGSTERLLHLEGENVRLRINLSLAEEGLANYAQGVERLRAALERIKQTRYGLEQNATDEERAEYWGALALEYRRIAAEALKSSPTNSTCQPTGTL